MTKSLEKVSVLLPVHNGEKYLPESISSVLQQSHSSLELIIFDDGSSDRSSQIAKDFCASDPRVRYIRSDQSMGLPRALNAAFQYATASLITWTSDDNIYDPYAIEEMAKALTSNSVDIVSADYVIIDESGKSIRIERTRESRFLLRGNVIGACFLFKRDVWKSLEGYRTERKLVEDYDFWIRAVGRFKFAQCPRPLYRYRIHPSSLTILKQREIQKALVSLIRDNLNNSNFDFFERLRARLRLFKKMTVG